MEAFDFFFRAERSSETLAKAGQTFDEYWSERSANVVSISLPYGTDLEDALAAAYEAGMPRGSARGGCFEIQCDRGIWSHVNERRIDGAPSSKVRFVAWEEEAA